MTNDDWFRTAPDHRVLRDHAIYLGLTPRRIRATVATALRTRSWGVRRVLATSINPTVPLEHLLEEVRTTPPQVVAEWAIGRAAEWVRPEDVPLWWNALARVVGLQGIDPTDAADALALYSVTRRLAPVSSWLADDRRTFAQLRWVVRDMGLLDDHDLLNGLAADDRALLVADLVGMRDGVGSQAWIAALGEAMAPHGVGDVTLGGDGATPFDRLSTSHTPGQVDGPLVTVIMSAYRPGPEIFSAVRSILDQTWRNLELLVVDDASEPEFDGVLNDVAEMDERVRVLRQSANRGTYAARNVALAEARGDLVTFQDSDDWSHPERLERQARPLLEDSGISSTMSRSIRCTPNMVFQLLGYSATRKNASSLMFRRAVLDRLGAYDTVRKSGDVEFDDRIKRAVAGEQLLLADQLAFVRLDADSLSRSDFAPGWQHPARHEYRESYYHWLRQVDAGRSPWVAPDALQRPFPAPAAFLRGTGTEPDDTPFDIVFGGDWRRFGGPQKSMIAEIEALSDQGMRIGVLQLEALRFAAGHNEPLCDAVRELISAGVVEAVLPDDKVQVRLLLIRYPPVLMFPSVRPMAVRADRVVIVANQVPHELDDAEHRYTVADVDRYCEAIFGCMPLWLPQGPLVRAAIEADVDPARMAPIDNLGIIDLDEWRTERSRYRSDRPVVGRLSRDDRTKWPDDPIELLQAYPDDPAIDVRVMGGPKTLRRVLGEVPGSWLVYEQGEIPPRNLLNQIDFFVYFHHPVLREAFGRAVLEAIAAGCLVVLPHHFEPVFGDAAVYCRADEVRDVVARLYADRAEFEAQLNRGRAAVEDRFSAATFRQLVASLMPEPEGTR